MYKQKNGWQIEKSECHVGECFVLSSPEEDDHQDVRYVVQYRHQNVPDQEGDGVNCLSSLDILTERQTLARREILHVRLNIAGQPQPPLETFLLSGDFHLVLSWAAQPGQPRTQT